MRGGQQSAGWMASGSAVRVQASAGTAAHAVLPTVGSWLPMLSSLHLPPPPLLRVADIVRHHGFADAEPWLANWEAAWQVCAPQRWPCPIRGTARAALVFWTGAL